MATYQIIRTGVTIQGFNLTVGRGHPAGFSIAGSTVTVPERYVDKTNEAFVRTGWLRRTG